jgi:hypothetical protein
MRGHVQWLAAFVVACGPSVDRGAPKDGVAKQSAASEPATPVSAKAPSVATSRPKARTKPAAEQSPPPPTPPADAALKFEQQVRHAARTTTVISKPHRIDKVYESMQGPYYYHRDVPATSESTNELRWIVGATIQPLDAWSGEEVSDEFVCHANVELTKASNRRYETAFGGRVKADPRLFTFVPGRLDVHFPSGFGIPIRADAEFFLATMALNLNEPEIDVAVRYETEIEFAGPQQRPMRALFRRALYGAVETDAPLPHPNHLPDGASCAPAPQDVEVKKLILPGQDTSGMAMHWWVPPGKHRYATDVTDQMRLPFDTTAHYATVHVHPYATRAVFRDRTTDKEVLSLAPQQLDGRRGVAETGELVSEEGVPVFESHEYELVVEYENPTLDYIDAMAILYLYLEDPKFGTDPAG